MVKITGTPKLNAKLKALRTATQEPVRAGVAQGAEIITAMQRRLCPVKTGALRESIRWSFGQAPEGARIGLTGKPSENETRVVITAGDRRAYYAAFVEFGAGHRPPHPFFFPGYRATIKAAKRTIQKAIKTAVHKAAGGN